VSTCHSSTLSSKFRTGVTVATQLEQLIVVFSFIVFNYLSRLRLSLKLFKRTETELNDIAKLAIIGLITKPFIGYNTPAAMGIVIML